MKINGLPSAPNTRFNDHIIKRNALFKKEFLKWAFYPGMLFASTEKWWGDFGHRTTPHEGVDLCFFMDRYQKVRSLNKETKIPVMFDGTVVQFIDDYLGLSIVVVHEALKSQRHKLITIYGHTLPIGNLKVGKKVAAGDTVATLADTRKSPSGLPCHLHISAGWISDTVSFDTLNWNTIGSSETVVLINPLDFILKKNEFVLLQ